MVSNIVSIVKRQDIPESPAEFTEKSLSVVKELLKEAIDKCCDFEKMVKGKTVLLKPNLVRPNPKEFPGVTTDLRIIKSMVRLANEAGAKKVMVGDNPGFGLACRVAIHLAHLEHYLKDENCEIKYFDEEETIVIPNDGAYVFKNIALPKSVAECDVFINLPKMKTHMHSIVTLGIKNLKGIILDNQRMLYHRGDLYQKVADILRAKQPDLTIVDAIWTLEGQAPLYNATLIKDSNFVVAGTDVVAVDSVASMTMGVHPEEVAIIRAAAMAGLGCMDLDKIKVVGNSIKDVQRIYKRSVISSVAVFPKVHVVEGGACSGCQSALRHSLDKLYAEGLIDKNDEFSVYVGVPMPQIESEAKHCGTLWCFGNCAVELVYKHHERKTTLNKFIPGCPPHVLDLYKEIKSFFEDK